MERRYHKFLVPFWVGREKDIEESLKDPADFWSNGPMVHATVCCGEYVGGVNTQSRHLWRWQEHTGMNIRSIGSIVELGAGYGAMCRIIRGVNDNPYTIIDVPVVQRVQKHFLRKEPAIEYVGLDRLEKRAGSLICDMFISCYALSESAAACVELVLNHNFFGAKHVLVCFYNTDTPEFKFVSFLPELKKFGDVVMADETSSYLFR